MKVIPIQCLEDNYAYILIDEFTKEVALIDPVEPEKVHKEVYFLCMIPKLVLTTHHHCDHAGGNEKIKQLVPRIKVYGGSIDNVSGCTDTLENGDRFPLSVNVNILALHTPNLDILTSFYYGWKQPKK